MSRKAKREYPGGELSRRGDVTASLGVADHSVRTSHLMTLHIGCGSWADSDYTGVLYPPGLPARERRRVYAQSFNHVEVNATYYATPHEAVTARWVAETPPGFTFNVKLHRTFSVNLQKTARDGALVARLLEGVAPLTAVGRLGTFRLVLAPSFRPELNNLTELDELVDQLRPQALAVELRHRG